MERQQLIQDLLQNMEVMGKAMFSHKAEPQQPGMPTRAQIKILLTVMYHGSQSIKSLSDTFYMTPSAATQLVNGLVREGHLKRIEDKTDKRKFQLELTAKGKDLIAVAKKHRAKKMTEILEPLTDTELKQLEIIQKKITERLQILWTKK